MRLLLTTSTSAAPQYSSPVDFDNLPPQLRSVLGVLAHAVNSREPAIRAAVDQLRTKHPNYDNHQLALAFIRSTRRRVAATGALSGAVSIAPGLGTVLAIGTITSQTLYALEQEVELVLGIAMIFGHELGNSDERVIEALVVVGITSGAVKLREDVLVAGGGRLAPPPVFPPPPPPFAPRRAPAPPPGPSPLRPSGAGHGRGARRARGGCARRSPSTPIPESPFAVA